MKQISRSSWIINIHLLQTSLAELLTAAIYASFAGILTFAMDYPMYYVMSICYWLPYTEKKENKISSYIRKFRVEQLQSHIWGRLPYIWGNAQTFPHIQYEEAVVIYEWMTLELRHSEFPCIWGKFDFLFYQCTYICCELAELDDEVDWPDGWMTLWNPVIEIRKLKFPSTKILDIYSIHVVSL